MCALLRDSIHVCVLFLIPQPGQMLKRVLVKSGESAEEDGAGAAAGAGGGGSREEDEQSHNSDSVMERCRTHQTRTGTCTLV